MRAGVERLPAVVRAVVRLRLFDGLSTDEVADRLGISPAPAKVRLHRAKVRLRAELSPLIRA